MSDPQLDRFVGKVLEHDPERSPLKVIAGAPDKPLVIGGVEIPCYVLEDETRVLSQGGFLQAIGRSRTPKAGTGGVDKVPTFLAADNLQPFVPSGLGVSTSPIPFQPADGGLISYGYPAELLPKVCKVYLDARDAGALHPRQEHIAARAQALVIGLATVGIIALVDEATGYQRVREERALATILERYIAQEFRPWTRTFPYEFYEQIYRLKGWGPPGPKRPAVIGHYTNDIVYTRLAPGILDELRERNPVLPQGWRKNRHHQWFTDDFGHPKLKEHIHAVIALMKSSSSWDVFRHRLDAVFPVANTTFAFALGDDDDGGA